MAKRVLSLIIVLILPIVMLCGCSTGERLSPEEYKSAVTSAWEKYFGSITELAALIPIQANDEGLAKLQQNASKCEALLNQREEAFNDFKIINPPKEYEELHKKLIKAIDYDEKEQLAITRKFVKAKTTDDISDFIEEMERISAETTPEESDIFTGTTFPSVYGQIILKLHADKVGE